MKDLPRTFTKAAWLEQYRVLFPHTTPEFREAQWDDMMKQVAENEERDKAED